MASSAAAAATGRATEAADAPPGGNAGWLVCIGLEVHAQILAASKLFSAADATAGSALSSAGPNAAVSLFDAALPGTLPSLNQRCVEAAVQTALALNCLVHHRSVFERKHYFYADLPLGFQITQLRHPIATDGVLPLTVPRSWKRAKGSVMDVYERRVGVERIQIEQDSGKSNHTSSAAGSLVDLNRAGVGLLEIVTRPDLRSAAEAGAFLRALQRLLRHIGTCDGNMEEGSMRCDVNVSLAPALPEAEEATRDVATMGQRVEMKNLNSIKAVMKAIEVEAERQAAVLARGGVVDAETRSFDALAGASTHMRSKEDAPDYRFFPEPDLLPLRLTTGDVVAAEASLPELPWQMQARYTAELGLPAYDASVLVAEVGAGEYFEAVLSHVRGDVSAKAACNFVVNNVFSLLKEHNASFAACPVSPSALAAVLDMVADREVSSKVAKDVVQLIGGGDTRSPAAIVTDNTWSMIRDEGELRALCQGVVAAPKSAPMLAKFAAGNTRVLGAFVGKAMAASGGRADPSLLSELMASEVQRAADAGDRST